MTAADTRGSLSRLIAIMIFAVLPAILLTLAAINFTAAVGTGEALAGRKLLLTRLEEKMLASGPATSVAADISRIYLEGGSISIAGASLRQHVITALASVTGKLIETRTQESEPADAGADSTAVSLDVTFDIANEGLSRFIYLLESGLPFLEIETLKMRQTLAEGGKLQDDPLLRVDMLVKGGWRPAAT